MYRHLSKLIMMGMGLCFISLSAQADKALVIGVNRYPNLKNADLDGCINDSAKIAEVLKKRGFAVNRLENPTYGEIIVALSDIREACKPDEKFLFYFAGHGTKVVSGNGVLLPSDAQDDREDHYLTGQKLSAMIRAVPAKSRTVFLDACFAEAVRVKSFKKRGKSRYYRNAKARGEAREGNPAPAESGDDNVPILPGDTISCFAAASRSQTAEEDEFEGTSHGIFTYYLSRQLLKLKEDMTWGEFQSQVTGEVSSRALPHDQTPIFFPSENSKRTVFAPSEGVPVPATKQTEKTAWELFNQDYKDVSRILVKISPNRGTLVVGQQVSFEFSLGKTGGYLVVLEKDTDDRIYVMYPPSKKASDTAVKPGTLYRFPDEGHTVQPDAPGTERVKAFLFRSMADAKGFLNALLGNDSGDAGVSFRELIRRDRGFRLTETPKEDEWASPFYTSMLSVTIQSKQDAKENKP